MSYNISFPNVSTRAIRGAQSLVLALGFILGLSLVSTSSGCGASLGTECTLTSDCGAGLYCVFGMCVQQCNTSIDCIELHENAICVKAEGQQIAFDSTITTVNACHKPQRCGEPGAATTCDYGQVCRDNLCWRKCAGFDACPENEVCVQGACRTGPVLEGGVDILASEGDYCEINSDCATSLCGLNSKCRKCRVRGDCFLGADCFSGKCVDLREKVNEENADSAPNGNVLGTQYKTCDECIDKELGAYNNECLSLWDACRNDSACTGIANCMLDANGNATKVQCALNMCGSDCTYKCVNAYSESESSRQLFYALDNCVRCTICKDKCTNIKFGGSANATAYCNALNLYANGTW